MLLCRHANYRVLHVAMLTCRLSYVTGRYADVQVASYLIDKGRASIHVTSNSGTTALHYAACYGNLGKFLTYSR